eukprot:6250396-Pyramimonas_sp.AAC.1
MEAQPWAKHLVADRAKEAVPQRRQFKRALREDQEPPPPSSKKNPAPLHVAPSPPRPQAANPWD